MPTVMVKARVREEKSPCHRLNLQWVIDLAREENNM